MFRQTKEPGRLGLSDFTVLKKATITLAGDKFDHRLFHYRLAYSGWCYVKVICGGESFTALSTGLQNALWRSGGSPQEHRTDSLSAAFNNLPEKEALTARYHDLCRYYGIEPSRNNRGKGQSPAILCFKLHGDTLTQTGRVELNSIDPTTYDAAVMGAHHASFRPDGEYIYVGSAEGHLFVIKAKTLEVEKVIKVGQGAGHTTFLPMREQAIITNHNDTFVSVIDTKTHRWIRNTEVADTASLDYKSQAHTTGVSLDMQYFYSAASHDGVFYRINLDTWVVNKTLPVDANLLMGSFIWDGDGSNM